MREHFSFKNTEHSGNHSEHDARIIKEAETFLKDEIQYDVLESIFRDLGANVQLALPEALKNGIRVKITSLPEDIEGRSRTVFPIIQIDALKLRTNVSNEAWRAEMFDTYVHEIMHVLQRQKPTNRAEKLHKAKIHSLKETRTIFAEGTNELASQYVAKEYIARTGERAFMTPSLKNERNDYYDAEMGIVRIVAVLAAVRAGTDREAVMRAILRSHVHGTSIMNMQTLAKSLFGASWDRVVSDVCTKMKKGSMSIEGAAYELSEHHAKVQIRKDVRLQLRTLLGIIDAASREQTLNEKLETFIRVDDAIEAAFAEGFFGDSVRRTRSDEDGDRIFEEP